ncbi:hypothetical protein B0P06_002208 [Clostridium saccharoperbutylacetonicum]|uniref:Uncharacterized protein n=1 Tax=Clostridium saccharoperbutylacetonicum N1-4(HMT) TaxID=931276 RepID=M1MTK4_9CLOT|nr:hypothetical protein Cspa_c57280 [Clostridium saccharoperbutylacetonicum N1-4(HMT)]NRT59754.1 hypothetical protein [Clostridium saccharoperbutylacetonicum]NSB23066.1 hypothetical protein [Clostridium saccharoperbutylacetonicum]NSB42437.1 hypothetical protein [Clostridium saccharoperbutylacetonicum]
MIVTKPYLTTLYEILKKIEGIKEERIVNDKTAN